MNHRMEQEMAKTIQRLRASMPVKRRSASTGALLRLAAEEMRGPIPLALLVFTILTGTAAARLLARPMLTAFCTAPMPALLLFHRYVLHGSPNMRELEATLPYSYSEMLTGRTLVISCYMLVTLAGLALALQTDGAAFLRLALCGAVPSVYLCALLLLLGSAARRPDTISALAIVLWIALALFAVQFPMEQFLSRCPTAAYGVLFGAGLAFYAVNVCEIKTGRRPYVADLR